MSDAAAAKPDDKKDKGGDDEEEQGYSCKSCWAGYCACIIWICKVFYFKIIYP
jgi:hypothetical protein